MSSFLVQTPAILICFILFILMILANRIGFGIRQKELRRNPENKEEVLGAVEGSLLEAGVDDKELNLSLRSSNEYSGKIWKYMTKLSQDKDNAFRF